MFSGDKLRKPRWDDYNLVPFEKHFYNPSQAQLSRDPRDVEQYRNSKEITIVRGHNVPNPITAFVDGNFPDYVMNEITRAKFDAPTAIQVSVHLCRNCFKLEKISTNILL